MLRHTRHIPRELMFLAHKINKLDVHDRTQLTIRDAVNVAAAANFRAAVKDSVVGWTSNVKKFAAQLSAEAIKGEVLRKQSLAATSDGFSPLEVLVRHGFLGYSDVAPQRHSKCFIQRFSYRGGDSLSALHRDFYFIHPSTKEWIDGQAQFRAGLPKLERMTDNFVADGRLFEAEKTPLVLTVSDPRLAIIAWGEEFVAAKAGVIHAPLKFLWLLLYAARAKNGHTVNFIELSKLAGRVAARIGVDQKDLCQPFLEVVPKGERERVQNWGREANRFLQRHGYKGSGPVQMRAGGGTEGVAHANISADLDLRDVVIDDVILLDPVPRLPG
jgi:hypothetical protein